VWACESMQETVFPAPTFALTHYTDETHYTREMTNELCNTTLHTRTKNVLKLPLRIIRSRKRINHANSSLAARKKAPYRRYSREGLRVVGGVRVTLQRGRGVGGVRHFGLLARVRPGR